MTRRRLPQNAAHLVAILALGCGLLAACASREPVPAAQGAQDAQDAPVASAPVPGPATRAVAAGAGDAQDPGEPAEFAGMLEAHNRWRAQVGTPPLAWSKAAAQVAQRWADQLAQDHGCKIRHSPGDERQMTWGENIYSYWRGGNYAGYRKAPDFVVDRWAGEGRWYDHASNTCNAPEGSVCGHFTQLVSAYSTHLGCGRSRCASAEVWVCNYSPPGNYRGVKPY